MSTKSIILISIFFALILIGSIIFIANNQIRHNKELKLFISKGIYGSITKLNDLSRGTYSIEIKQDNFIYETPSLPIAWEIKEYNIQVGDSISKEANSKAITFYKVKNSSYKKCCEYEM